jgi:hypothetical protein
MVVAAHAVFDDEVLPPPSFPRTTVVTGHGPAEGMDAARVPADRKPG